jgi:ribonuclease R
MPKESKKSKNKSNPPINKTPFSSKLFNNILKTVQQFAQGKGFTSMTHDELMHRLHLPEQHRTLFTEVLNTLVHQGYLESKRGRFSLKKVAENVISGVLRLHPRGFGFVKPDNATIDTQDIFIPKPLTMNAVDGDIVEVLVNTEVTHDKGPEGRVVAITTRSRTHLAGIVKAIARDGTPIAYAPMLGMSQNIYVESQESEPLIVGDRIVMKVIEWGTKDSATICQLSHRLGHITDSSCDIPAAIEEFELRKEFPAKAIEEAGQFGTSVSRKEIAKREDLRELTCFTIDPDTAKDFDDAISLSKDDNGHYHLGVHIADVSHYVQPGSALDIEAQLRCNSTYFPGYCLPMLPRELSDNLCSLKPNVNRLTVSVSMTIDPDGNVVNHRIFRSVIKSAKRFTYREAKDVLDGKKRSTHLPTLNLMVELCGVLKKQRYERGSVEFALPDLVVLVDEKGMPTKTDYIVYDITHQLVEEFMLKANEMVALHLSDKGKNLTYRIHDVPSEENMKDFSLLAGVFGFTLSEKPTPREIQKLFEEAMDTPYGPYLATSYIRRMRLAVYSADNIGHYGLSLTHYCHFTSPIRRYVDLVVHRILFHEKDDKEQIEMIAARCSDQERISAKAENSVVLLKKLRLLDSNKQVEPFKEYQAVVTRVKNFGVYFEIVDLMIEGYLHVSELDDDYYIFDETANILKGRRLQRVFSAGDRISVMLKDVDFITLESAWSLVSGQEPIHADLEHNRKVIIPTGKKPKRTKERKTENRVGKKATIEKKTSLLRKPAKAARDFSAKPSKKSKLKSKPRKAKVRSK